MRRGTSCQLYYHCNPIWRGRACWPAHVDVLIQPAPPDDAPRVLIAYPPVGIPKTTTLLSRFSRPGCVEIPPRWVSVTTLSCWPVER